MNAPGRCRGFTLIEILVALVIVGIVVSVALLSINLVSNDRELDRESRRLAALIGVARDDAMFQGREFGIEMLSTGYRFVEFDPYTNQWAVVPNDPTLRHWELPDGMEIELFLDDRKIRLDREPKEIRYDPRTGASIGNYAPHLLIYSSGDMTPFEVTLLRPFDNAREVLRGDLLGNLEFDDEDAAGS